MATKRHEGKTLYEIQYVDGAPRLVEVEVASTEPRRGLAPWLDGHQVLLGLLTGGLLVACLVYVALITVVETLGHPAYAVSTDVKGSPNVTVSAIPVTTGGSPGVLMVQADGTVKGGAATAVSGVTFLGGGGTDGGWFGTVLDTGVTMSRVIACGRDAAGKLYTADLGTYEYGILYDSGTRSPRPTSEALPAVP